MQGVAATWADLTMALVGIGSLQPSALLQQSGNAIAPADQATMRALGAVGDVCTRFFDGDVDAVPRHCLTQGLGTILESRHAVVIATGFAKAVAVREMVEGAISARWPCSALQLHPTVTVLVDEAAASGLELADYYREVTAHRDAVR